MINLSKKILNVFKILNLNEIEIKIYIALLEGNKMGVTQISDAINLSRTNTYNYLERLISLNLISKVTDSSTLKFQAAEPKTIEKLLKNQKENLDKVLVDFKNILPDLNNLQAEKNPTQIRIHEGEEGLKNIVEDILKSQSIKFIFHNDHSEPYFPEILEEFNTSSIAKKKNVKELRSSLNTDKSYNPSKENPNHKVKTAPKEIVLSSDSIITDKRLLLLTYQPKFLAVEITNKSLVDSQNSLFDFMWNNIK